MVSRVSLLFNPETAPFADGYLHSAQAAAPTLGATVIPAPCGSIADIEAAFDKIMARHAKGDVGEQRREDSTLRRSGLAPSELLLGKNAGLQECQDKSTDLRITNPTAQP